MIGGTNDEKIEDNDPVAGYGLGSVLGRHHAHHGGDEERQRGRPVGIDVHGGRRVRAWRLAAGERGGGNGHPRPILSG